MTVQDLTDQQIDALANTRHAVTGIAYPPDGLQPYYQWLMRTLHLLAEASCGPLRVAQDDASPTTVAIAPGRASISGAALAYGGGTIDLAAYNNDTAYLWLYDDAGSAAIGVAAASAGWPGGAHIKLAEVTLAAGSVTGILDRRFETILSV